MDKSSTVLLVEDHRVCAKIAKNILSNLNCQVDIAMDGKTTLEMLQSHHYDLIFMDIGLPDMTGYEITRRIRSHELSKEHIPIIALTAHADDEHQQKCFNVAMNAVINKPLTKQDAKEILNTFIMKKEQHSNGNGQNENLDKSGIGEEKILDLEYAKKLLEVDETVVREMLTMLVNSLSHEAKKLEAAWQEGNWELVGSIVHKLKGGSSYCGTLRLNSACTQLDDSIKSGRTGQLHDLYQQLLFEIGALQKFMAS